MIPVKRLLSFICRAKGHKWLWHCFALPGDGRTCSRCGLNQTWAAYWEEKRDD